MAGLYLRQQSLFDQLLQPSFRRHHLRRYDSLQAAQHLVPHTQRWLVQPTVCCWRRRRQKQAVRSAAGHEAGCQLMQPIGVYAQRRKLLP